MDTSKPTFTKAEAVDRNSFADAGVGTFREWHCLSLPPGYFAASVLDGYGDDWCCGNWYNSGGRFTPGNEAVDCTSAGWDMSLFSRLGTDVHFTGEESGMRWEKHIFELQTVVELNAVMSRGADERTDDFDGFALLHAWESANREMVDQGLPGSHTVPNNNKVEERQEREPSTGCWQQAWTVRRDEVHRCFPVAVETQREPGRQVDEVGATLETGGYYIAGWRSTWDARDSWSWESQETKPRASYAAAWISICVRQWTRSQHSLRRWTSTLWCQRVLAVSGKVSWEVTKVPLAELCRLFVMESKLSEYMKRKDRKKTRKYGER